eukprot:716133-Pelagomonas_calceolata.AAC.1
MNEFAEVCMLQLCRLNCCPGLVSSHYLIPIKCMHMPLVHNQLVGLSHAVGCCGPQCGVVSAA